MAGYDPTFGTGGQAINDLGGVDRVAGLGAAANGKLIALNFVGPASGPVGIVTGYNADGSLDTAFNTESSTIKVDLPLLRKIIAGESLGLSLADISKGLAIANLLGTPTIDRIRAKFNSVRFPYPIERLLNPESFISNPTNFGDTIVDPANNRTYTAIYDVATKKVTVYADITSTQVADTTFGDNGKFVLPASVNFMGSSVSLSIVLDSQGRQLVSVKGIDDSLITVVRLNQSGSIDSSFGTNGKVQLDSKIGQLINPLAVVLNTDDRLSFGDSVNNDSLIAKYDISGKNPIVASTRSDFNGDGKSDILWRNNDGQMAIWQMNGFTSTIKTVIGAPTTDWKIANSGDFDGDSKSDILWRNDDGQVAIWQMDGSTPTSKAVIGTPTSDWKISGTADFNGDGKSDILWRNDSQIATWLMSGTTAIKTALSAPTTDWKISGTGDFNGDGKADILWRNDDGSIALWQMNGSTLLSPPSLTSTPSADSSWKINGIADFNGDGKSDILWRNDNGQVAVWTMNGATALSQNLTSLYPSVDNSWKITGTGDFSSDGKADILWRNDNGSTAIWQMDGSMVTSTSLISTSPASTPLVVDSSWKIAAPIL
jgi:hypothetical protein